MVPVSARTQGGGSPVPRLICDANRCTRRPILALADPHVVYLTAVGNLRHEREGYVRFCRDHAAECGVEQLEQPRMFVQAKIDVPAVAAAVRDELVRMGRGRGFA